jgi:hypothetical protein
MKRSTVSLLQATAIALFTAFFCDSALAYIGPGAGLGALGTVIAFFGTILLAIVGFVWYPIKRLLKGRKRRASAQPTKERPLAGAPSKGSSDKSHSQ